jgi:hypothetical protein
MNHIPASVRRFLKLTLYVLLIVFSIGGAAGLIWWNWAKAAQSAGSPPRRPGWYVAARNDLAPGRAIEGKDLKWVIGWVPGNATFITAPNEAVGKYPRSDIKNGQGILPEKLSEYIPAITPAGGAILPVEVKTDHITGLTPGDSLAFVGSKQMIPAFSASGKRATPSGFKLIALTPSTREAQNTSLLIEVPPEEMKSVAALGQEMWRPVRLGSPVIAQPKPPRQRR